MAEQSTNPHLYGIIAGEVSGDTLGAGLMKAIVRHDPQAQFIGIGGPKMIEQGLDSPFAMDELSVMGFFEVLSHLVPILRIRAQITKRLLQARPVVFIGIDSPDFNLTVERRLKAAGITTVHYVSPSVWAWREGRMEKIKRSCDEVLALLPFEKDYYDRHQMPCTYVGHTLAAQIAQDIDQNLARERCGLYKNCVEVIEGKVLAVLPGSRSGIIQRMLPLYAKTARLLREKIKDLTFITVAPNHDIAVLIKDIWLEHAPEISLTVFVGKSQDVIASADVCLLTCGTVAFEAMLLKRPMVVAYKVSKLSATIARRLLKVDMYSLPNLLAQRPIVKELIQDDCTPINMCAECIRLLTSDNLLMKKEFATIHERIRTNTDELAARAVLRLAGHLEPESETEDKPTAAKAAAGKSRSAKSSSSQDASAQAAAPAETQVAAPAEAPADAGSYHDFLHRTKGAAVAHKEPHLGEISTAVLDTAKGDEVPLEHGLDDATVTELMREAKAEEPKISLEDLLHSPDTAITASKSKRSRTRKAERV